MSKRCYIVVATKDSKIFVFNGPENWQKSRFTWNCGEGTIIDVSAEEIASVKKLQLDKTDQLPKDAFFCCDRRVREVFAPPPSILNDFDRWWEETKCKHERQTQQTEEG